MDDAENPLIPGVPRSIKPRKGPATMHLPCPTFLSKEGGEVHLSPSRFLKEGISTSYKTYINTSFLPEEKLNVKQERGIPVLGRLYGFPDIYPWLAIYFLRGRMNNFGDRRFWQNIPSLEHLHRPFSLLFRSFYECRVISFSAKGNLGKF